MVVNISTTPDKMEAYIKISNILPGEQVTLEKLMEEIRNAKIVHNIDIAALKHLCENPVENTPILFAKGDEPKNGEDGRIVFEVFQHKPSFTTSGNRVDFREFPVQKRIIVKKGQKIATVYPPTEGVPGRNVYGEPVPAKPGNEAKVVLGKNVALSEDGAHIIATSDGILKVDPEKGVVEVSEYLEIEGNVDYATGNIEFPGVVFVKGDVKPGFIVRARGDIEIQGVAEASTIISLEGSIKLTGAKGKDKGLIKAKKNVHVKYAESVTIECENLYFESNLLNCMVRVTNAVIGQGRSSAIIGGECIASTRIEADELGSDFGVKTYLEVGVNPYLREELKLVNTQIEIDRTSIQKLVNIVKQYKELKERGAKLTPDKEEQFSKAARTLINLREQLEKNLQRKQELEKKISEMRYHCEIVARKMLYPGVEVYIHDAKYLADRPLPKVVLRYEDGKVVAGGYSGT
ncbi:hypothetical protein SAMN04488510_10581 [Fervidobacterium changbaicum]|uniref:FapA family protein n=2 Tax=Fervidobacterium TaxID=2422 RepID=A0AAI8CMH6_FERIS|nr:MULTISPECIES: FapA family protein [Fervidobacterium]AMW33126.1 FapA family protein [Fervidobacterium islandicum]QAV33167.1 DUF342 domain-containing protein [Fervidobacterium changbaicum]SDH12444.1 hypothetical protein SAMN04488510_10581 [Fervidobacterium changbaicum]